jgi:hypothetical protein
MYIYGIEIYIYGIEIYIYIYLDPYISRYHISIQYIYIYIATEMSSIICQHLYRAERTPIRCIGVLILLHTNMSSYY